MRRTLILLLITLLTGCSLDKSAEVRVFASEWLKVTEVQRFKSRMRCSAAVLRLEENGIKDSVVPVSGAEQAAFLISHGIPVALQVTGRTPHELSSALMSEELSRGLGLIGVVTGATGCMEDAVAAGASELVNTPGILTLYDPKRYTVIFVDAQRRTAVYLRTRT